MKFGGDTATKRRAAEATPFVAFMLQALLTAMSEVALADQVSDQVKRLLATFRDTKTLKVAELMTRLGL